MSQSEFSPRRGELKELEQTFPEVAFLRALDRGSYERMKKNERSPFYEVLKKSGREDLYEPLLFILSAESEYRAGMLESLREVWQRHSPQDDGLYENCITVVRMFAKEHLQLPNLKVATLKEHVPAPDRDTLLNELDRPLHALLANPFPNEPLNIAKTVTHARIEERVANRYRAESVSFPQTEQFLVLTSTISSQYAIPTDELSPDEAKLATSIEGFFRACFMYDSNILQDRTDELAIPTKYLKRDNIAYIDLENELFLSPTDHPQGLGRETLDGLLKRRRGKGLSETLQDVDISRFLRKGAKILFQANGWYGGHSVNYSIGADAIYQLSLDSSSIYAIYSTLENGVLAAELAEQHPHNPYISPAIYRGLRYKGESGQPELNPRDSGKVKARYAGIYLGVRGDSYNLDEIVQIDDGWSMGGAEVVESELEELSIYSSVIISRINAALAFLQSAALDDDFRDLHPQVKQKITKLEHMTQYLQLHGLPPRYAPNGGSISLPRPGRVLISRAPAFGGYDKETHPNGHTCPFLGPTEELDTSEERAVAVASGVLIGTGHALQKSRIAEVPPIDALFGSIVKGFTDTALQERVKSPEVRDAQAIHRDNFVLQHNQEVGRAQSLGLRHYPGFTPEQRKLLESGHSLLLLFAAPDDRLVYYYSLLRSSKDLGRQLHVIVPPGTGHTIGANRFLRESMPWQLFAESTQTQLSEYLDILRDCAELRVNLPSDISLNTISFDDLSMRMGSTIRGEYLPAIAGLKQRITLLYSHSLELRQKALHTFDQWIMSVYTPNASHLYRP